MKKTLAALALLALASPAFAADPIDGRWITEEKDAVITIGDCGSSTCGKITKFLKAPPQGAGQRDVNNSNPKLRSRKLLGMPVLTGFTEESDLWRGEIYDPKGGKTYRSVIRRKGNTLEVKGCLGPFCQTQIWRRAG
ncbi:DUF2147 domain-containing protein [Erythrobacter litoralis]|uniref:DUF2147 domain-containing protein n=1 Tax=Erythrobacter litoralis TaxID=39960 RepID=UPI002435E183|nr:DUF2147 domain-containing protein [Erythrobacter litoralis]MDG6079196.1 DUF2147 domain-containing protein [Erythrobacter litoralis]